MVFEDSGKTLQSVLMLGRIKGFFDREDRKRNGDDTPDVRRHLKASCPPSLLKKKTGYSSIGQKKINCQVVKELKEEGADVWNEGQEKGEKLPGAGRSSWEYWNMKENARRR